MVSEELEQRLEGVTGENHADIWQGEGGGEYYRQGNSLCRGPEVGVYMGCLGNSKASVAAAEWAKGRIVGDEVRKVKGVELQTVLNFVWFKIHLRMLRNRNLICLKVNLRLKTLMFIFLWNISLIFIFPGK